MNKWTINEICNWKDINPHQGKSNPSLSMKLQLTLWNFRTPTFTDFLQNVPTPSPPLMHTLGENYLVG